MKLEYELLNGPIVNAYNDYYEAKNKAKEQGLQLAEYGDVYGTGISYAYWNERGNRNEDEKIIAYYKFNENGKPTALSEEELRKVLFY